MKTRRVRILVLLLLLSIGAVLGACSGGEGNVLEEISAEPTMVTSDMMVEEVEANEFHEEVGSELDGSSSAGELAADTDLETLAQSETERPNNNAQTQRLIIKDGNMTLVAMESDAILEDAVDLAVDLGGYVISQRI